MIRIISPKDMYASRHHGFFGWASVRRRTIECHPSLVPRQSFRPRTRAAPGTRATALGRASLRFGPRGHLGDADEGLTDVPEYVLQRLVQRVGRGGGGPGHGLKILSVDALGLDVRVGSKVQLGQCPVIRVHKARPHKPLQCKPNERAQGAHGSQLVLQVTLQLRDNDARVADVGEDAPALQPPGQGLGHEHVGQFALPVRHHFTVARVRGPLVEADALRFIWVFVGHGAHDNDT
mmetsp:Transcript_75576/g.127104  ORF Transcript_75576/g.127104 Transcript_75576/m.127104 type:complete len:235 (-) Transcript_75576:324-1028(-)